MSEWRDISTAPRDGVFVLLHNDRWSSDVEGFWHKGSQSWSANTRIPGIENRLSASSGGTRHSASQRCNDNQRCEGERFCARILRLAGERGATIMLPLGVRIAAFLNVPMVAATSAPAEGEEKG